ncbi:MAG: acetylglutamate kinase, partial [Oscillospiraceae bacterium]|nr:acetylglutamate kinase [Oscillospiraceae bacterium]
MDNNAIKAQILVDALPYIQKYNNKTVVIKYGGNAMISDGLKRAVMDDIILLSITGVRVVLVHGGGPEITEMLAKIGKESRFINGLRYTDRETAEIVQMVLAGKINKGLVASITNRGGKALGLCGSDAGLITAVKLENGVDLGFVGEIENINPKPVTDTLDNGYIPVIATVAAGKDGEIYNINADTAAARIAAALSAETLILMTDVRGLLRDVNDENTLIPVVKTGDIPALIEENVISGGMIPKIGCCREAVSRGVKKTF